MLHLSGEDALLAAKALKDRKANLQNGVDEFKRAYGKHHGHYTMPLLHQIQDIDALLATLEVAPLNLYFICAHDNDGESLNLFVRAHSPAEAFELWKATDFCSGWSCCFEGVLSAEPADDAGCEDARIFLVPESSGPGAIAWHAPNGVNVVAHANPI